MSILLSLGVWIAVLYAGYCCVGYIFASIFGIHLFWLMQVAVEFIAAPFVFPVAVAVWIAHAFPHMHFPMIKV